MQAPAAFFGILLGIIRDQLSLPQSDTIQEEILLKRKAIATDYTLDLRFGVVYTFGSVLNSIINTRYSVPGRE